MNEAAPLKSVLITGGAGFIGSHSADLLLQKQIAVTIYDNFSSGKHSNLALESPLLKVVEGDVLDYEKLAREVASVDAVLHLAAIASVPKSIEDPLTSHAVNSTGFVHVLEAIKASGRQQRLVYASSSATYGDSAIMPCPDDQELHRELLSPYALHKVQMEQYAALFRKLFQSNNLGLRYFNVYGSRQDPSSAYSGVISLFMDRYLREQNLTIYGDGKQSRDFIHVSDIARANYLALHSQYQGVLNIATGQAETLKQLLAYIEKKGGSKAKVQFAAARLGDIRHSYAKTDKALACLDFQSTLSLEEGISYLFEETKQHFLNTGETCPN